MKVTDEMVDDAAIAIINNHYKRKGAKDFIPSLTYTKEIYEMFTAKEIARVALEAAFDHISEEGKKVEEEEEPNGICKCTMWMGTKYLLNEINFPRCINCNKINLHWEAKRARNEEKKSDTKKQTLLEYIDSIFMIGNKINPRELVIAISEWMERK